MIEFEILECPDGDVIGKHSLNKDKVSLGRTQGDLLIFDDELSTPVDFVLENSKLYLVGNEKKFISLGRPFIVGRTRIVFTRIDSTKNQKKEIVKKNLKEILEKDEKIKEILDILEKELSSLK